MDFSFNENQQDVQNLAQQILTDISTQERLNQLDKEQTFFDQALWQQLAESGLLAVALNEQYGGMGFGFTELCLLLEEVGASVAEIPAAQTLVSALAIQQFASAAQKDALLSQVANGQMLLTTAFIEPASEDFLNPETTAIADGDNFRLTGTKTCVPYAKEAGKVIISAMVNNQLALFLLDTDLEGVSLTAQLSTTREPWYEIALDNVAINQADVLALDASDAALWLQERASVALCAMQVGVCKKMLSITAAFTCEREQFGVAIGSFQAVQHRAADCFIDNQCLKLTTYQAASLLDEQASASTEVLIAKIWAGDTGHRVSYAAQHLHGGTGIDKDYPLWRYCLWARQNEMVLGSSAMLNAALGKRIAAGEAFAQ